MDVSFEEAWSISIDPYVSESDWDASVVSDDLILLTTADGILGIDGSSGQVRWVGNGPHAHPKGEPAPLYRVGTLAPGFASVDELVEIEPRSGEELAHVKLENPQSGSNLRVAIGGGLIVIRKQNRGADEFVAFDSKSGKSRWSAPAVGDALFEPYFLSEEFIVRTPYQAYALADGRTRWTVSGTCCDLQAKADGSRVYVRTGEDPDTFAEIDKVGDRVRDFAGRLIAATDIHVAFDTGGELRVVEHGSDTPVAAIGYAPELRHVAVALTLDAIFYFDQDADTLWRHDLRNNTKARVVTLRKTVGFSTERAQVLEPFLSLPPKISSSRVYLMERSTLRAFNVVWAPKP